jgi:threonine dehydrogenase-like Zn-dependent dehydrogenase
MQGTVLYGTRDVRFEEVPEPKITKPTDAIIRVAATCVCGSDLWSYRGISPVDQPTPMGHEYCGIVEEVGSGAKTVKPCQFVIGSFFASDNTCPYYNFGYPSSCRQREFVGGAQAPLLRVPRRLRRRRPSPSSLHTLPRSNPNSRSVAILHRPFSRLTSERPCFSVTV